MSVLSSCKMAAISDPASSAPSSKASWSGSVPGGSSWALWAAQVATGQELRPLPLVEGDAVADGPGPAAHFGREAVEEAATRKYPLFDVVEVAVAEPLQPVATLEAVVIAGMTTCWMKFARAASTVASWSSSFDPNRT